MAKEFNVEKVSAEIHSQLILLINEKYRAKITILVPTGWTVLGVRVPALRKLAAAMKKQYPQATLANVTDALDHAFAAQCREEVLCTLFWLAKYQRHFTPALWPKVSAWVDGIIDWESCDQLATGIAAPIVHAHIELVDDLVAWTHSDNQWRRRFTLAIAAALNQKGRARVAETLRICDGLMLERVTIVRKAVGWALREACKHDTEAVYRFLLGWKSKAPRTTLRQAAEKLSAEHRSHILSP